MGADPVEHRPVALESPFGSTRDLEVRARVVGEELTPGEGEQVGGPVRGWKVVVQVLDSVHDLVTERLEFW